MEYDFEIYQLSQKFFTDYPETKYPELMHKSGRPYSCLLIDSHDGYFICVPYRSSIGHKNSFLFKNTQRSKRTKSGLDYSKIAIVTNTEYFDKDPAIVDKDEYNETVKHIPTIAQEVVTYVDTYINHINGNAPIHQREFDRKYQFSTLKYFHDILLLNANDISTEASLSAFNNMRNKTAMSGFMSDEEIEAEINAVRNK